MQGEPDSGIGSRWWRCLWGRSATGDPPAADVTGLEEERQALQAALQRKRRNDRVRVQELEALRALMRARTPSPSATSEPAAASSGSSSGLASAGGACSGWNRVSPDKSRTIEQIARIEAQMSQQWLSRTARDEPLRIGAPTPLPIGSAAPAGAADGLRIDVVGPDPALAHAERDALLWHPALTEAAVRFANGRLEAARQALEALLAQEVDTPLAQVAGTLLLDWYWSNGDVEGFEEWAAEWADRFGRPVPRWPLASSAAAQATKAAAAVAQPGDVWVCPPLLDLAAVQALAARARASAPPRWMDWTDWLVADAPAARGLLALFEDWAQRPLTLHWRGSAVLRRRLKASTPSGRRDTAPVWWQLRLAALRLLGRRDEFDLVALDYCVTYGDAAPVWREPVARVEGVEDWPAVLSPVADAHAVAATPSADAPGTDDVTTVALGETAFPALSTHPTGWSVQTLLPAAATAVRLEGVIQGDIRALLASFDAALADGAATEAAARLLRIDAQRLQRLDFAAAGALLQWLLAARGRGVRVELEGVGPLLAVLLHVVGIDEVATVRLRQY
ncbi:STAS domain-containing protein [Tepidimonas charontis]|uniref:STAS domain protein n=1 Tax=Tepidimonas charontis TaxID=2267262 RepID=A0A554XIV5_9BURK|nr:STAS domain-containing protein [Tepidimonas charontis]TSE35742.1 STAS domain protein [Tepidimonas charontis]